GDSNSGSSNTRSGVSSARRALVGPGPDRIEGNVVEGKRDRNEAGRRTVAGEESGIKKEESPEGGDRGARARRRNVAVPVVAIVGRPNVGKSSLFNWLARRRIAIVEPTAGVTRDRISSLIKVEERFFEVVDTGGLGVKDVDNLTVQIERQID